MKHKVQITTLIIFFLITNTTYFWEDKVGFFGMLIYLVFKIVYFVFLVVFIIQLFLAIKEKFKNKSRFLPIGLLAFVLLLTFLYPAGIINFEKLLERENLLVAQGEGAANCTTTFYLKDDFTFIQKIACFKVERVKGTYRISNDTIYFIDGKENIKYEFAIIEEMEHHTILKLFKNNNDTTRINFPVFKNDLKINCKTK